MRTAEGIDELSVHHTAGSNMDRDEAAERKHLIALRDFHVNARGWPGIGYWYVIFRSGRVYRTGLLAQQRASVRGQNHHIIGVALAGNFEWWFPSDAALDSLLGLRGHLERFLDRSLQVRPHLHYGRTKCPGALWERWLPAIAA